MLMRSDGTLPSDLIRRNLGDGTMVRKIATRRKGEI